MKGVGSALLAVVLALVSKDSGPLPREVVGIGRTAEEGFNEFGPFGGVGVGEKEIGFGEGRETTRDIESHAPHESGLIREIGGRQSEGLQLSKNAFINEVGRGRKIVDRSSEGDCGAEDVNVFLETNHNRSAAGALLHGDPSVFIGHCHLVVF